MDQEEAKHDILRSALTSAQETIKACLFINAGSATALIALLSHLFTEKQYQLAEVLAPSIKWFVFGAVTAVLGHACSYASNLFFAYRPYERGGDYFRIAAVVLVLSSIACFAIGACRATASLGKLMQSYPKPASTSIQQVK
jgi:hypothetical protein